MNHMYAYFPEHGAPKDKIYEAEKELTIINIILIKYAFADNYDLSLDYGLGMDIIANIIAEVMKEKGA